MLANHHRLNVLVHRKSYPHANPEIPLLLGAEFGLVLWLRGVSISEYFATRDPVSGTAYFVALLVFSLMPVFVTRR